MTETWALFDRLADRYDQAVPYFATCARQLVDIVDPTPGSRVLDIGTGRGAIAIAAASRGCEVTAIDGSARMIELLAARHPGLSARVMDAMALDLPAGSFDLACAGFMIHLVADPARVLAELRRVLRPGGAVALTLPDPSPDPTGRWAGCRRLMATFAARAGGLRPPDTRLDVAAALRQTGFTDLRRLSIKVRLQIPDPQTCWQFGLSHGFARLVEALSAADAAELERLALAEFVRMHADGGIVVDQAAAVHLARVPG
ncbi:hypothetical protein Cs7R123_79780 [Catellatospora sp. TT07R-123]|uniref:class I SAM-dependent methyltransferase n=1 Tax=Catellatospora sp. TT07R-123 TaxID=2733863 RepID=UPI001B0F3974|nr:class I SAM-dependent methyltransferase [Catellatospora sp. TT07R-123]GHJ50636.1 hypothetical protein Cs7R123_79780 [Catellatospora sp. TT07R-123]